MRQMNKNMEVGKLSRTLSDLFAYFEHAKSTSRARLVDGLCEGTHVFLGCDRYDVDNIRWSGVIDFGSLPCDFAQDEKQEMPSASNRQ